MNNNLAWIYLFIASCCEICWIYSVKFVSKDKILHIHWGDLFANTGPLFTLLPLVGYIVFGITNIFFFSMAMKSIPAATAFAVWTGVALIGAKVVDTLVFGETINLSQVFFFGCILVGIIGLRVKAA